MGPPEAAGRWSLVAERLGSLALPDGARAPAHTQRLAAVASALLERHGIVTRDAALAEEVPGGFGGIYPVLREMEERGRVRRGYFVEGLGGAQFALPGAVDRLRSARPDGEAPFAGSRALLLAAADPANPYGAALPWPRPTERHERTPGRSAGAYVVLHDGELVLYLERGGHGLLTYPAFDDEVIAGAALDALGSLTLDGRLRQLQVERIDGVVVAASPHSARLERMGFRPSYRGLVRTAPRMDGH
jgi:ATP-dependent Lhr-like helicase